MGRWMRRMRGALGIGLTWAAAWFGAGMVLLVLVGPDAADVPFPLFFGLLGFLAGVAFSVVLGLAEGRRRIDQISLPRFAMWGGLGAFVLSSIFVLVTDVGVSAILFLGPIFAFSGAACAAGTLVLARKAQDRPLLDDGTNDHVLNP